MLSRARLILLSGVAGAGTTTITAATAAALRAEGLQVEVIDASEPLAPDQSVVDRLTSSVGRVFAELGADPVLADVWATLPGITHLSVLARIGRAMTDGSVDTIVVDAGDHRQARELVELPGVLLRLLDAALTPRLAMRRSADPVSGDSPSLFEALSDVRLDVVRMAQGLAHPSTTMRLVTIPEASAIARTERSAAAFAMLGIAVDGIVVNRFPRKAEGGPKGLVANAEALMAALVERVDGVAVWSSTSKVRPAPKGRSAMGPLGRVSVLDAEQLTVIVGDEEFRLDVPLAGPARQGATIGVQGDHLIVAFDGAMRWLELPPVLRRCIATHADRSTAGLRVAFVPDPASWREPAAAS